MTHWLLVAAIYLAIGALMAGISFGALTARDPKTEPAIGPFVFFALFWPFWLLIVLGMRAGDAIAREARKP